MGYRSPKGVVQRCGHRPLGAAADRGYMNAKRTLRLRKEILAVLATEELEAVAGADSATALSQYFVYCVTDPINSRLMPCPTPPYSAHC